MPRRAAVALVGAMLLAASVWVNAADGSGLAGSEWKPLRIDGREVPEASSAFVQFRGQGRLEGFGGCNRLLGEYEASDRRLSVNAVAATRKACDDAAVMQVESALLSALEDARSYHRERISLVVFGSAGQPLLEMRQTDWD